MTINNRLLHFITLYLKTNKQKNKQLKRDFLIFRTENISEYKFMLRRETLKLFKIVALCYATDI